MTELERIIAILVAEMLAQTAETCADDLDRKLNSMSGAQALRNFAAAIRANNTDHEAEANDSVH
jgi:hypothetical protein